MWDTVEELENDPRQGKRVFCVSLLPKISVYGTIQCITRYSNKNMPSSHAVEIWNVLTDHGMTIDGPNESFVLYTYATEFQAGDRVHYVLDHGEYWTATILSPTNFLNQLGFTIKTEKGDVFNALLGKLSKL